MANKNKVQSTLTKKELENIFSIYKAYMASTASSSKTDNAKNYFESLLSNAEKHIHNFALGNINIEPEAFDLMELYIEEFGKNYIRQNQKLVYKFTQDAAKAKLRLKKLRFYKSKMPEAKNKTHAAKTHNQQPSPIMQRSETQQKTENRNISNHKHSFWNNISLKLTTISKTFKTKIKNYGISSIAVFGLSSIAAPTASSSYKYWSLEKTNTKKVTSEYKAPINNTEQNTYTQWNTHISDSAQIAPSSDIEPIVPFKAEYAEIIAQNKKDYQEFVQHVSEKFSNNINELNNSNSQKKLQFYKQQGQYLSNIGKSKNIIPNRSCESMSNVTLLSVAEQNKENFISKACQNILQEIPNPHACFSSLKTLKTQKTKNLGDKICQIFEKNPNAIVAAWIHNSKGGKHRINFVGSGNGNIYMFSYNNDRIKKINKEKLGWLKNLSAEYHTLSTNIINKANDLAISTSAERLQTKHQKENLQHFIQLRKSNLLATNFQ